MVSPPATGKTWFLRCFAQQLEKNQSHSVQALWVEVDDLLAKARNETADSTDDQLTEVSKEAWFQQFYQQIQAQCRHLSLNLTGRDISAKLELLVDAITSTCFNGKKIVLVIDNSDVLAQASWQEFERTILEPLLRKNKLYVAIALREDQRLSSFIIRRQQHLIFLGGLLNLGDKQIERLNEEFDPVAARVACLLKQVPAYDKTHPGINTFLFLYAQNNQECELSFEFLQHLLPALNPYMDPAVDELIVLLSQIAEYRNEWVIEELAEWLGVSNGEAWAQAQRLIDNYLVVNISYNRFKVADGIREFVRVALASTTAVILTTTVDNANQLKARASQLDEVKAGDVDVTNHQFDTAQLYLFGPSDAINNLTDDGKVEAVEIRENLRKHIEVAFNTEELEVLCFDIGLQFEDITPTNVPRPVIVVRLIKYCKRHGRYTDLLDKLRQERPNMDWPF